MVRIMAGTLIDLSLSGPGDRSIADIIASRDRGIAGSSRSPEGCICGRYTTETCRRLLILKQPLIFGGEAPLSKNTPPERRPPTSKSKSGVSARPAQNKSTPAAPLLSHRYHSDTGNAPEKRIGQNGGAGKQRIIFHFP